MCKFTITSKLENYKTKKYEGEFIKLRTNDKLVTALKEVFEVDGDISKIIVKVEDQEYCY